MQSCRREGEEKIANERGGHVSPDQHAVCSMQWMNSSMGKVGMEVRCTGSQRLSIELAAILALQKCQ